MKIRELRNQREFSLRTLAECNGLTINTLSLVENGKSSPSVCTLQQLTVALEVPITTFFESEPVEKQVVFATTDHSRDLSAEVPSILNSQEENCDPMLYWH